MGRGRPTTQVIPGKPPQGGRPNIRNPFQPLESATTRGRGGRETEPGYAIGPADGLIPYVNDPRLKGKKLDYSKSPYRMIRNQYERFDQPPKPKGDIGIGGGPGVPPRFPRKDRPIPIPFDVICPDPEMGILMADGSQKKAGDLVIGDLVKTHHEESFELGDYEVEHVDIINDVEKIKLTFDKSTIICSLSHKFYVGDSWKEAKDMIIGDVVSDNKLVAIESVEDGDVVHITVKDAHTYICEGLLSHNKSPRRDPETGDIIPPSRPVGRRRSRGRRRRPMNSCPDPNMLILMADDTQKRAGDLVVGDLVKTNHEKSLELGNYEVEFVDIIKDVEKIKLTFEGSEIICSLTHKFYVDNTWKEAKDMVVGDVVSDKKLTAIEKVEDGDVVHITVKDAHTYICEGLLSHNKRFAPGYGPRGSRPPRGPRPPKGSRPPRGPRPLTGGYNPKSGVRYTDTGVPTAVQETTRVPVQDPTLGGPPEREVPIPKERLQPITRESDPRGPAPFSPDEKGMARDRFFERMFDRAEEAKQRKSMQKEERREVRQARKEERSARRMQPGEINVGGEIRDIGRSIKEESVSRRMQPGEIDVGGEIDINAERGGRRMRRRGGMRRNMRGGRRDFTRRKSRMQGGRQGRSMEERAAFRDRYVSTLGGGFFS